MPRNKRGSLTPRGGRGGRGGNRARGGRFGGGPPSYPTAPPGAGLGFTLADEARQTSQQDHSAWGQNTNLRKKPVQFISAGNSEPLKQLDSLLKGAEDEQSPAGEAEGDAADRSAEDVVDRHVSPSPSLEEVVGPEELERAIQTSVTRTGTTRTTEAMITVPEPPAFFFDLTGNEPDNKTKRSKVPVPIPERASPQESEGSSGEEVIFFKGRGQSKTQAPARTDITMTQMREEIQVVEEALLAAPKATRGRSGGRKSQGRANRRQRARRRAAEPEDDDDDGKDDDDALLADYIANMQENGEAESFFDLQSYNRRDLGGTESELSGEDDETGDSDRLEAASDVDNQDIAQTTQEPPSREGNGAVDEAWRSESELDDETLAKLIAGAQSGPDMDIEDDELLDSLSSSDDKRAGKSRLNTYDEFDPMDWERPSLRRKKGKGARAQPTFNVSDSELEQRMVAAWSNDRLKKSQRKTQREEDRAAGLLRKRGNKPEDLTVKYPAGMSLEQVAEEIRAFLLSNDETLSLPPMDKHARKMVHEIANKFSIKSKSAGKADHRRPVLYRTKRTLPYVESTFDVAVNRINRRYFPRLDSKGKRSQKAPPIRSNDAAASYRDGEIVGAAAPELGTENRGRNMLEKMGWSTGTALGAVNNKGILQPVTQAMKRSKAGLG